MISQKNILKLASVLTAFSVYGEAQSPAKTLREEAGVTVEDTARQLTAATQKTLKKITLEELAKLLPEGTELPQVGTTIILDDQEYLVIEAEVTAEKTEKEDTKAAQEDVKISDIAKATNVEVTTPAVFEAPVKEESSVVELVTETVKEETKEVATPAVVEAPAKEETSAVESVTTEEQEAVKEEAKEVVSVDPATPMVEDEKTVAAAATTEKKAIVEAANDENIDYATPMTECETVVVEPATVQKKAIEKVVPEEVDNPEETTATSQEAQAPEKANDQEKTSEEVETTTPSQQ